MNPTSPHSPVRLLVVGAGQRGQNYAQYAHLAPHELQIVAVAEPQPEIRARFQQDHQIDSSLCFEDWQDIPSDHKIADAVLIATQDQHHTEPAVHFARLGYPILLEKPMATTLEDCEKIVQAVQHNKVIFGVCHVLLYTQYTQKLKKLLDDGLIGEVVSVQHLEPVGFWHQAHSYVRGNWRREDQSSSMLLAKSCHDLDWLRHMLGLHCQKVSSYGSLRHFRPENQPEAPDCCLDCPPHIENLCPYSAKRFYMGMLEKGEHTWPLTVLTSDLTETGVLTALQEGPYGRCVYRCDNDAVDHQVVNMEFEKGITASFTMTGFTRMRSRETRFFGTRGELYGDGSTLTHYDFLTDTTTTIPVQEDHDGSLLSGHGGGDFGLMKAFVDAVKHHDQSRLLSGPAETLESHQMVFAAEASRKTGKQVAFQPPVSL